MVPTKEGSKMCLFSRIFNRAELLIMLNFFRNLYQTRRDLYDYLFIYFQVTDSGLAFSKHEIGKADLGYTEGTEIYSFQP